MPVFHRQIIASVAASFAYVVTGAISNAAPLPKVDFQKDVQPIFSAHCYECHGPDKQKGQLRVDSKEIVFKGGVSETPAIIAGSAAKSHLVMRVLGEGGEDRMPLKRPALSEAEIATIRAWVDQGAVWPDALSVHDAKIEKHWSFIKPVRPALPAVQNKNWVRNPIDAFVLARLEKEGLKPSPEADRVTLIRRANLDLIGLPPTPAEVDAFVADKSPQAYEKLVDRLLASPHYGERWGRLWLDVARYADTNGYEKDRPRTIWPYRDWVINALNTDMPFDRFTVAQIAGDMLPNATPDDIIATGFHRNTMTNEEGGIDVEEFRFKNIVDRVQTTATGWLGLTLQCAQCHNHKYDPVSQKEYYRFFALLNNADEPGEYRIPNADVSAKRAQVNRQVAALEASLEGSFPAGDEQIEWTTLEPTELKSTGGATFTVQPDRAVLVSGVLPETDRYTVTFKTNLKGIGALRLETLPDASFPRNGPGRQGADNGNYVITELNLAAAPTQGGEAKPVALQNPQADLNQPNYTIAMALDGNASTGWGVDDGTDKMHAAHAATFKIPTAVGFDGGTTFTLTIDQGVTSHTLGKFRISVGQPKSTIGSGANRRETRLQEKLAEWEAQTAPTAGRWTVLRPTKVLSKKHATMTVLADNSVLASGDWPNNDTYDVDLESNLKGITAIKLEVLPDESLPDGGPGRAPLFSVGDFMLSELALAAGPASANVEALTPVKISGASQSVASAGKSAAAALDGRADTGWAVGASTAKPASAVFNFEKPLTQDGNQRFRLSLVQQYIHQSTIGRFRVSVTTDAKPAAASILPADVELALSTTAGGRSAVQRDAIKRYYLSVTPELASIQQQIAGLRQSMPKYPTSLAMEERLPQNARVTQIHHRGEFFLTREAVEPGVPKVLNPLPKGAAANRLGLARWLIDPENPLTARVIMNRAWATFFGRGIVATVGDFGTVGERPSHPELLDWLATEFEGDAKWSQKTMHRMIVMSATYRQASGVSPDLLAKDSINILLARGPRFRVEAEGVRDIALSASGLLDPKIGGPSVYPPQPDGISELSYGAAAWPATKGGDRFRRGLYTYLKRTSPYPGLTTFDGTTADVTCVMRVRSNTPLQALTILNDQVFVEAAQGLARRIVTEGPKDTLGRIRFAYRLCIAREPDAEELDQTARFHDKQLARFRAKLADATAVAVSEAVQPPAGADLNELAAWTTVSRALLNLDETITKE